jgi:prepilin-type N-terminal cleavage/methylation domain-containing protein
MLAGLRRRATSTPGRTDQHAGDGGFTLIEVLVASALIGIVMTAVTAFFVTSMSVTAQQSGEQTAVQLADDGTERVRALDASRVAAGRGRCSPAQPCTSPAASVAPYLTDMLEWDHPDGSAAALPTAPKPVTINGVEYLQGWYLGKCWQPADGGDCALTRHSADVEFFRVVVAVTWQANHCTNARCSYAASTLVNASVEPLFNSNQTAQPPAVNNPGDQLGEVTAAMPALLLSSSGGAPPVTWSATGLPPGLSLDPATPKISGRPTAVGNYPVTVSVKDGFSLVGTAAFTWVINAAPQLVKPANQTSTAGTAAVLWISVSGGTQPLTWSATGLPPGLSIDPGSGKVSGTPTTVGTNSVAVTVTDRFAVSGSTTFTWTVIPRPTIVAPTGARTNAVGNTISVQASASGGAAPYTWTATNLPAGLTMNAGSGLISGTLTGGTRYLVTVTVTDKVGGSNSVTFAWSVTAAIGGLHVTSPAGDRTGDRVGQSVAITAQAAGGIGLYRWAATGLPPGITVSTGGVLSGHPTQAGTSTTTLTVQDLLNRSAIFMFTWTVQ